VLKCADVFSQLFVYKPNALILLLLFWSAVLLKYSVIASQSVTLGWDPSSDPNEISAGTGTSVTIAGLIEGVTYYFAATTYLTSGQESGFSDEVPYTVPATTANPPITNYCVVGQNVILNLLAGRTSPLNYKWKFNSTDIPSATNGILTLNNIATNQAGAYSVTVVNGAGMITNLTIFLAVYPTAAATLTPATVFNGPFSFDVAGVPGLEYTVQASTNLVDWGSVQTNVAPFVFKDPDPGPYSRRFYRTFSVTVTGTTSFPVGAISSAWADCFRFFSLNPDQF
jgi:hypothetical protein